LLSRNRVPNTLEGEAHLVRQLNTLVNGRMSTVRVNLKHEVGVLQVNLKQEFGSRWLLAHGLPEEVAVGGSRKAFLHNFLLLIFIWEL
jgi:hypothetical protein